MKRLLSILLVTVIIWLVAYAFLWVQNEEVAQQVSDYNPMRRVMNKSRSWDAMMMTGDKMMMTGDKMMMTGDKMMMTGDKMMMTWAMESGDTMMKWMMKK